MATTRPSERYLDPTLGVDERLDDLLSQMTLAEKVGQLKSRFVHIPQTFESVLARLEPEARVRFERSHLSPMGWRIYQEDRRTHNALLGSTWKERWRELVFDAPGVPVGELSLALQYFRPKEGARFGNEIQEYVRENSRLKIPVIIHDECLHGGLAVGSSSFPQSISMAATFDPVLYEQVAAAIGREARSRGIHQALSPTVNLARDARSGRVEETYGEDTVLAATFAAAFVRGAQSEGLAAMLKHFIANFVGIGGRDSNQSNISERHLRQIFLPVFKAGVEAGAMSVMPAYGALDGLPCHTNRWLLTQILREEWGFSGYVGSDYEGVRRLVTHLRTAEDAREAARQAITAGMDVELPAGDCFHELVELVESGELDESVVTTAAGRVLRVKFELGLFDSPPADPEHAAALNDSPEHRALALRAARETFTLLANDGALPLSTSLRRIALLGPNANRANIGEYSGFGMEVVTPLVGLREFAGSSAQVVYRPGATTTGTLPGGIEDAVEAARSADVAVLCMGDSYETQGEGRDRSSIHLPGSQEELILKVAATGTPVVVVLFNGSALICEPWIGHVAAILEAWYPGEEGGTALAEVLFGEVNPAGRLPITFPKHEGQLPLFYNREPTGRGLTYVDLREDQVRFPFGHGLSYTIFIYEDLEVTPTEIASDDLGGQADHRGSPEEVEPKPISVRLTVTNTGEVAGDEVVQLYVRDLVSTYMRPVKALRSFARLSLSPGESSTVTFNLGFSDFADLDREMNWYVEPGAFEIQIGASSEDIRVRTVVVVG